MEDIFPVVVSDMDGTLLDHDSYDYDEAAAALAEIARRGYPLILASSKTAAEMIYWQDKLGLQHPFICENGAAIGVRGHNDVVAMQPLGCARKEVLLVLKELREAGFAFRGFDDCTLPELVELTGLSAEQAEMASRREYSEPVLWLGNQAELLQFSNRLAARGMIMVQGGRFLSIAGDCDKGRALSVLRQRYCDHGVPFIVALGDSPNDESMLAAADVAVIIRSVQSNQVKAEGAGRVIRTQLPGPAGWQQAMGELLLELTAESG